MTEITTPHFAYPFRIVGGQPAVNEQDTDDDVRDCVEAIVRTPAGTRVELPEFGRPDETFALGHVDPAGILTAVEHWEPRAAASAAASNLSLADYVAAITVEIERGAA